MWTLFRLRRRFRRCWARTPRHLARHPPDPGNEFAEKVGVDCVRERGLPAEHIRPGPLEHLARPPGKVDWDDRIIGAVPDSDRRKRAVEVEIEAFCGGNEPAPSEGCRPPWTVRA